MANLTLEDIARQAGVSRSTVSRVVNNHPNVSERVRTRVLDVIQTTGYHPNAAARSLASQRTWMIGLVLPRRVSSFFTDPYFPHLTQGIAQACNRFDLTLGLFLVSTQEDERKIFPRVARQGTLDGILVLSDQIGDQLIARLMETNMPLVLVGRPYSADSVSYVDIDNINAAHNAVRHLTRLKYERIAMISGPEKNITSIDRQEGYRRALAERNLHSDDSLLARGDFTELSGYYAMKQLIPARPQAVFAASDIMAIGAMRAAREAGLRIPEDVAFVGFDDLPLPAQPGPQLTTVRQPVQKFGSTAVEILIDVIENGIEPPRRIIMSTELIVRESCGASGR